MHFLELILERKKLKGKHRASEGESSAVRTEEVVADEGALKKHVFLSYCRDNREEVKHLREDLVRAGERVWWDQDIYPGQDWKFEIRKAMQDELHGGLCGEVEVDETFIGGKARNMHKSKRDRIKRAVN